MASCNLNFYRCKLIRVIDGDTIEALIDLGFHVFTRQTIRLYGIDAYESRTSNAEEKKLGLKAKKLTEDFFKESNGEFLLKTHKQGKFRRYLGEIFVEGKDESLNQLLLKHGLAYPYFGGPKNKKQKHKISSSGENDARI